MATLFDPLKTGDLDVPNRIFLAPLTRNRSTGAGRVPNAMMREYYVQRASAGLIISEATSVAPGASAIRTPPAFGPTSRSRAGARSSRASRGRRAHFPPALACRAHLRPHLS